MIAQAWLPGTNDPKIMPASRHRAPSRRPLWILAPILLVCMALVALYVHPLQRYSACYFFSSSVCSLKEWLPPVHTRVYNDDELAARVVIRDILLMPAVESKNPKIAFMFLTPGSLPFEKLWEKFFLVQLLAWVFILFNHFLLCL